MCELLLGHGDARLPWAAPRMPRRQICEPRAGARLGPVWRNWGGWQGPTFMTPYKHRPTCGAFYPTRS